MVLRSRLYFAAGLEKTANDAIIRIVTVCEDNTDRNNDDDANRIEGGQDVIADFREPLYLQGIVYVRAVQL